jgi:hypothetical protein
MEALDFDLSTIRLEELRSFSAHGDLRLWKIQGGAWQPDHIPGRLLDRLWGKYGAVEVGMEANPDTRSGETIGQI